MSRDGQAVASLDSPLNEETKGDGRIMAWNFFALDVRNKVMDPMIYDDGHIRIEVKPGHDGMANQLDKDFLIYVASLMIEKINKGEIPSPTFTFKAADFFRIAGRMPGGSGYSAIEKSLGRLQGTQIKTNIRTGNERESVWWSWLKTATFKTRINLQGVERRGTITVELCEWLYNAIIRQDMIRRYSSAYFDLDPLPRRLYEVGISFMENGPGFVMPLNVLQRQIGSQSEPKHLKQTIKGIIENDGLPDFRLAFADGRALQEGEISPTKRMNLKDLVVVYWPKGAASNAPGLTDIPQWSAEMTPKLLTPSNTSEVHMDATMN